MAFRLLTLGSLELHPKPELKVVKPKDLALLTYLRLETGGGRTRSFDELHALLFSTLDRKKSTALSQALSRLRSALDANALTQSHNGEVALLVPISCDASDLLEARKRRERRPAALAGYRGEFLRGFSPGDATQYPQWHTWVAGRRRYLKDLFLELSALEAQDLLDQGDWQAAEAVIDRAFQHESAWPVGAALRGEARASQHAAERGRLPNEEASISSELLFPAEPELPTQLIPPTAEELASESAIVPSLPDTTATRRRFVDRRFVIAAGLLLALLALGALNGLVRRDRSRSATGGTRPGLVAAPPCGPGEARAHRYDQDFKPNVANVQEPSERFSTAWHLQNVGACSWDSTYRIHKVRETSTQPLTLNHIRDVSLSRLVPPGDTIVLRVAMQSPGVEGAFGEDWELLDGSGKPIPLDDDLPLRARIRVQIGANAPVCARDSVRAEMVGTNFLDNAVFRPGDRFVYTWTVMNRTQGTCALDSHLALRFRSAPNGRLSDPQITEVPILERVLPSFGYTFEVPMRAPVQEGRYVEEWYLTDASGEPIPMEKGTQTVASITVSSSAVQTPRVRICNEREAKAGWWRSERIADNTRIAVATRFIKKWTVPNTGSCMWPIGTHLHYVRTEGGRRLSASGDDVRYVSHPVPPNLTYTFTVPMVAQPPLGERREYWALHDANHNVIQISLTPAIWVEIFVID